MSVINGQNADATTFNSAFASKSADNTLQGKQTLARPGSGATVVDTQQAINDVIASDALKIPTAEKGVANGVATLDASTLIPVAQVPDLTASKITDFNTSADALITAQKGAASGIAPLDGSSKIDASYLPSYVDDVVEVANYAALPGTGETGKIYVTLDTNKTYRWSGSVYVQIGQPIASTDDVPEGAINQYFTSARVADKQIGIQFQDQGTNLGTTATVNTIDFVGAGITATRASNKVTVEVTATGSGGGSKNYFSQSSINPDFETGTVSPWQAMTTTWSGNTPVNAPTPGAVLTSFYTNIVSPLAGTTSATMTKGNGNGQYEGVMSGIFTIDREDLAKVLYGSFAYEVSGTAASNFDVSGTSTQTLEIWVYNVNANQWIQPAGFRGINQFTGTGKVTFSFQTDATDANNQYQICLIVRQNTTGIWNFKVDDFSVGPQAIVLGTPVTDWINFNASLKGSSVNPNLGSTGGVTAKYRRVGDSIELNYRADIGGTGISVGSGTYYFSLPNGLTIDSSKLQAMQATNPVGIANVLNQGVAAYVCQSYVYSTTGIGVTTEGTQGISNTFPAASWLSSSDSITVFCKVPIVGFSSNVQTSSDTDTRVVASSYYGNSNHSTVSGAAIPATNTSYDSHSSVTLASGRFTAPVSGYYDVMMNGFARQTGIGNTISLYRNNSGYSNIFAFNVAGHTHSGAVGVYLNAGDYIDVRTDGAYVLLSGYNISVARRSGPSVITATETVAYRGGRNAGNYSISSGSSVTFVPNSTIVDTHGSMNTSTGIYTVPISGIYEIIGRIAHFTTTGAGNINVSVTAGGENSMAWLSPDSANNNYRSIVSSMIKRLNAGDTIYLSAGAGGVSSTAVGNDVATNSLSIKRIGS